MNEPQKNRPWATIWLDPRGTIRQIIDTEPNKHLMLLIILGGLGNAFSYAANFGMADMTSFTQAVVLCLVAGPLSGFFSVYLWGWLLQFSSKFFGGFASRRDLRIAVAWSWAPVVYLLPLWGVKYILFKQEIFKTEKPFIEAHQFLSGLLGFFDMLDFFVTMFTLFILFNAVAEVNGFSIWKSIGSIGAVLVLMTIPAILVLRYFAPM